VREILLLALVSFCGWSADVCDPRQFQGSYAFQLSGEARISSDGLPKPAASLGNLKFDGSGGVSGYSSAEFAGYLQGNPTTGKYEAHTDCSIDWSMQDDSGAYQHFSGKMLPDFSSIEFRQTDPGGPQRGAMLRTPAACTAATLHRGYRFSIAGNFTPMEPGQEAHRVSLSGTAVIQDGRQIRLERTGDAAALDGTFEVDSDCVVRIETGAPVAMKLRGFLVADGKEILAIQTDPGYIVTAHFTAQ